MSARQGNPGPVSGEGKITPAEDAAAVSLSSRSMARARPAVALFSEVCEVVTVHEPNTLPPSQARSCGSKAQRVGHHHWLRLIGVFVVSDRTQHLPNCGPTALSV